MWLLIWQANWKHKPCECWLSCLPFMGTLPFDFYLYGSHYSHTAWWKPIFIENGSFCKRIKPKIISNPDHIFGLAELLVTLTLHTALPLSCFYHLEEICHPDLIFWPTLLFGTREHVDNRGAVSPRLLCGYRYFACQWFSMAFCHCPSTWAAANRSRPKLNYGSGSDFEVGPEFGATRKQPIIPGNSRARLCADEEDRVTWLDLRPG